MSESEKKVDESWKDTVEKEKASPSVPKQEEQAQKNDQAANFLPPEPDFNFFLSTLALQASIFLGDIPNPATNQKEENLPQAKFIIDTLSLLKDKTTGNLSTEEDSLLENILYDLRTKYVNKTKDK